MKSGGHSFLALKGLLRTVRRGNFNGSIASLVGSWLGGPLAIARRLRVDLNIVELETNF